MKLTRSRSLWLSLWLWAPLATAGCGEEPAHRPVPTAAIDNAIRVPALPGEPTSLARVTADDGYQIERMRLSGDYLFFATHVLYRMPKYGGELTVVDTKVDDRGLAANATDVFWEYDRDDTLGAIEVSRYATSGVSEGTFPIDPSTSPVSSFEGNDFLATNDALFVYHVREASNVVTEVVTRYPLNGDPPNDVVQGSVLQNWVVDGERMYYTRGDGCDASSCVLESVPVTGGAPTVGAALPSVQHVVVGSDAEAVYLASRTDITRMAKADGALTSIFAAPTGISISRRMVLDARPARDGGGEDRLVTRCRDRALRRADGSLPRATAGFPGDHPRLRAGRAQPVHPARQQRDLHVRQGPFLKSARR
jgi:hypothetical protein